MYYSSIGPGLNGTYLVGKIHTNYRNLVRIFGTPQDGDGEKVSTEWIIDGPDGETFTIYDWKVATPEYPVITLWELRSDKDYDWHIGGKKEWDLSKFQNWIKSQEEKNEQKIF